MAPRARAGNWLPTGGIERYMLVFRFYKIARVGVASRTGREDADAIDQGEGLRMNGLRMKGSRLK